MMTTHQWRSAAALFVALVFGLGLAGCSRATYTDGSRATLYSDIAGIARDSSVVAVVTVGNQSERGGDNVTFTVSSVTVERSFQPGSLGGDTAGAAEDARRGTNLTVLQLGSADHASTPAPLLERGREYLLFLTPSDLEGDLAAAYFVTGGDAGIYSVQGDSYSHATFENGDTLPRQLTPADLTG